MNRRGEISVVVKIVLWLAVIALMLFIVQRYIVGAGGSILSPFDGLKP